MKRTLLDRIQDRAWREIGDRLAVRSTHATQGGNVAAASSISSVMPWTDVCAAYAGGHLASTGFRRNAAVRDIVETVGPVEGRFYADRIREWGGAWLTDPAIRIIDSWGNPIRWPASLLGTPVSFSPTTLRYLATALWIHRHKLPSPGKRITEIGVGFGGLAAMNALVSKAYTLPVDLPVVEESARKMLNECGLGRHIRATGPDETSPADFVISNYAFTELSSQLQDGYFEKHIRHSRHGMILSNSSVFAASIRGRSDAELVSWFRAEGLPAELNENHELLGPGDHLSGVTLIHW